MIVRNEFAAVEVAVDREANGDRLKVRDLETGVEIYLDALELQSLVWLSHRDLEPILDPSAYRWREDA